MQRVGIIGFRGYSGGELIHILNRHPRVRPVLLEHREEPSEGSVPYSPEVVERESLAAVFLATPPDVSMSLAGPILARGAKVIDLSGAFRLKPAENYSRWYKADHTEPALLAEAVYGLPESCRSAIPGARLISNPGCYPTAANLAIQPLVEAGVIDRSAGIVCDAKSGVSGAGRKASLKTSFGEVTENFSVYGDWTHRHVPEVLAVSGLEESEFTFTAQLLPVHRGILETIFSRTKPILSASQILDLYHSHYKNEPFIHLLPTGQFPDLRAVQHTNFCAIGVRSEPATGRAIIVSAIDNLGKGAAGQAVQNMNLALGFPETDGLL